MSFFKFSFGSVTTRWFPVRTWTDKSWIVKSWTVKTSPLHEP